MSNGSKSVNDGCLCQEEQSEKTEHADQVMHSIQSTGQPLSVSHTRVSRLAPPSGLRGSCVEAVFFYVTCL